MNVNITDTFTKSLNRIAMYESWWYKTYSFFRRDLWYFFSNIWKFRKELYEHRWWDYRFTLEMLYRSIAIMEQGMHDGIEIRETREKKIQKMQRLLYLLDNKINDKYTEIAEKELGYEMEFGRWNFEEIEKTSEDGEKLYKLIDDETPEQRERNGKIIARSREIEESEWSEIWQILKGQDSEEFKNLLDTVQIKSGKADKDWNDWFDGTGLRGWWD
jgi:hypothetical protein